MSTGAARYMPRSIWAATIPPKRPVKSCPFPEINCSDVRNPRCLNHCSPYSAD